MKAITLISQQVREDFCIDIYREWCESVTLNHYELQKVIANPAIAKWFAVEYAKCESEFERRISKYLSNISENDLLNCYSDCTLRLFNIRPMTLLKEAKKPETEPSYGGIRVKTRIHPIQTLN